MQLEPVLGWGWEIHSGVRVIGSWIQEGGWEAEMRGERDNGTICRIIAGRDNMSHVDMEIGRVKGEDPYCCLFSLAGFV